MDDVFLSTAGMAREVIAETLLIFDIALLFFIASHLRREYRNRGWANMRVQLGNQAAIAVAVHIFGLTIIRAWTTAQYWLERNGYSSLVVEDQYQIALLGLIISVIGMACCIRIFSPARWGNWGWMLSFVAALGFVGLMQI